MINELISVVIPVYNNERYFEKCISSVINQTYKNIEIIIINDCSKDNVENIILNPGKEKSYKITTRKPYKSK